MKTALITGSETFGQYLANPSKWLALTADGTDVAGYTIHSLVLPAVVLVPEGMDDPGTTIVKAAQAVGADVIISFGLASEVKGFRLERSATNWIHNQKYLSDAENNRPLDPSRPAKEQIQLDISSINLEKLQGLFADAAVPFDPVISDNPGQYSCNGWMYRTQVALQKAHMDIPAFFVHTACTEEAIALIPDFDRDHKILIKNDDMLQALEFLLQSLE